MLNYSTTKSLIIQSWRLRFLKLFFQILVLLYLSWVMLLHHEYQTSTYGFGFTRVSVGGAAYGDDDMANIWDNVDTVFPPKEHDALFITASYHITRNQSRTTCAADLPCDSPQCKALIPLSDAGVPTGSCVNNSDTNTSLCQVYAWCPLETNSHQSIRLQNIEDFHIHVRNFAKWDGSSFSVKMDSSNDSFPWTVGSIMSRAGVTSDQLLTNGSAVAINIVWDCDLDFHKEKGCKPKLEFLRLDDTYSSSSGYNFRYTRKYRIGDGKELSRDLVKVYGLRLIFLTTAIARKFNLVYFFTNVASAIGMLFLANYLSDMVSMWCLPTSSYYRNQKYMNVDEQKIEAKRQEWRGILSQEELNKAYF